MTTVSLAAVIRGARSWDLGEPVRQPDVISNDDGSWLIRLTFKGGITRDLTTVKDCTVLQDWTPPARAR